MSLTMQQALFYRSLAALYNSGIHITRALQVLSEQMEHPRLRSALPDIARRVEGGQRLSEAMARHGLAFPPLHSSLVALGEQTGSLHLVLDKLARQAEKANELRARLRAALTYPLVIFAVAMLLLMAAPAVVFKDLLRLLQELQVELPWTTRLLIGASRVLGSPALVLVVLGTVGCAVWFLPALYQDRRWRRKLEGLLVGLPLIGPSIRAAVSCDFCRALATCYVTGIPILRGLELSAQSADHLLFQDALMRSSDAMRDGAALHEALSQTEFFPKMLVQMVAVGEESGRLSDMLERVAALAEVEVEQTLVMLTAALQPLMLLFIGFVVGFVVVATMTPMLQVVNSL